MKLRSLALALGAATSTAIAVAAVRAHAAPAARLVQGPGTAGTLTVSLTARTDGLVVEPFAPVGWAVFGQLTSGDNLGLALFSFDLVQDAGNPQGIDIPPAITAGPAIAAFDRPAGFTNPGPGPSLSGFGGTADGPRGRTDRRQIGGAQNTFGVVGPCLGPTQSQCMGQDVVVDQGVAQGLQGVALASGEFRAPGTPGTYTLRIENVLANTLQTIQPPPLASTTRPANIVLADDTWTFTVQ